MIEDLTLDFVKESLIYNANTGEFFWNMDRPSYHFKDWRGRNGFYKNIDPSGKAGSPSKPTKRNPCSYIIIGLAGKNYKAHRLAWFYHYGSWPNGDIDHINLDTQDNRISNLMVSENKLNHRNRSKYSNNTSGVSGVSFYKRLNKWQAEGQQVLNGKRIRHYLGVFESFLDACAARKSWEIKYDYSINHGKSIDKEYS